MANRCILHRNHLDAFKEWLKNDGWEIEDTKGLYEVLRARKEGRREPLIIFEKAGAKEHLSVMDRDLEVVKAFLSVKSDEKISESVFKKIKAEIEDEKEAAYADFERYKVDYLGVDADDLPDDDFRYGMERALEIFYKHMGG